VFIWLWRRRHVAVDTNELDQNNIPEHIAIIMDGNGRWAKKRGLPRSIGHKRGSETLHDVVRAASDIGIKMLTVYAFSTENWKRPQAEIDFLMKLLTEFLDNELPELQKNNICMRFIGDTSIFRQDIKEKIAYDIDFLAKNDGMILNIALNYGGRTEIVRAAQSLAAQVSTGKIDPADINEELFAGELYTPDFPDVDLLIRTSRDFRVSNYLLWQIAYAEMYFTATYWPDFTPARLVEAIVEYQKRSRRFGGL
jgi:undecaprenyl diphosphate synthase